MTKKIVLERGVIYRLELDGEDAGHFILTSEELPVALSHMVVLVKQVVEDDGHVCHVEGCDRDRDTKLHCRVHAWRLRTMGYLGPAEIGKRKLVDYRRVLCAPTPEAGEKMRRKWNQQGWER